MAISIEEKKRKIKETRSRAVQQKINLLWARDGSTSPEIESSSEEDDFNLSQLFGGSKSSQIDWTQLGVEGLIRCYYEIIYKINGKVRNNPITNNRENPNGGAAQNTAYQRSDLTTTAEQVMSGTAYKSGYFVGNAAGFEGKAESGITINQQAAKGEYDYTSSTFLDNRDKVLIGGSYSYPPNDTNQTIGKINDALSIIGDKSPLGPITGEIEEGGSAPSYTTIIPDTILGNRFADVINYSSTSGGYGTEGEWQNGSYSFGNGSYDFENNLTIAQDQATGGTRPPGYQYIHRDYYDSNLDTLLQDIKNKLQEVWQFIEYTKVNYDNFFMNPSVIPGRDDNWSQQVGWQASITNMISIIDTYLTDKVGKNRLELDALIIGLKTSLNNIITTLSTMASQIDTVFGNDVSDASTLYGFRTLWIKNLIDVQNGGSKITLVSIGSSIEDADKKIAQTEESFGIIGVTLKEDSFSTQKYWDKGIATPIIGGIETHMSLDQRQYLDDEQTIVNEDYLQMIPDGLILAWEETAHATAYTVYKSNDYDPISGTGTWIALIPSGQTYTIENIDINTGKVLSYYIDYDVDFEAEENPYYKVQAFDIGQKATNNWWWYGATSEISDAKSADDFISTPSSGTNIPGMSGPPPARPDELPDYLFKYATIKLGSQSTDSPINKTYKSDVEFDSIGSNLEVFVNGVLKHKTDDYIILNSTDIQFLTPTNPTDKITLIVYFGSSSGSGSWKAPVATMAQRPSINNNDGDVILVLENNTLYSWDESEGQWYEIKGAGSSLTHTDLSDMPDTNGLNADHDARYPRREEVNTLLSTLQTQLDNLSYLIPDNAIPLTAHLTITNTPYYTGYLSGGQVNTFRTLSAYQQYNKIVVGDLFVLESTNKSAEFSDADKGVFSLYINDTLADSINLGDRFIESERGQQQSWTPYISPLGKIEIISIAPYNNFGQYQKCDFKLNISKTSLTPGENKINLYHIVNGETRSVPDFIFFWDATPTNIFFDNYVLTESLLGSQKYLSGVRYYSIGDKLNLQFTAQSLFNNTYIKGAQIEANCSELGVTPFSFDYTSQYTTTDGIAPVTPNTLMPIIYKNSISLNQINIYSTSPIIKLKGNQPHRSIENTKLFQNVLINTWTKAADDKHEYFIDEKYRLPVEEYNTTPANYQDLWNSRIILGNKDLLLYDKKLAYPGINFLSGYYPNQTINYSGLTGERHYIRAFIDSGEPHNNGIFTIKDNIFDNQYIKIMMKLSGQTGWLDLKKPYNEADFHGADNDGCLVEYSGNNFKWTSGGYSTALSGYMIILRVTMSSAYAPPIEEISINW